MFVPWERAPLNRVGIPVFEIRTVKVSAAYWGGDGNWIPTTVVIRYIKNR